FALAGGLSGQVFRLDAVLASEPGNGLCWRRFRRTLNTLLAIRLLNVEALGAQHQPPGSGIERYRLVRDAEFLEELAQVRERIGNHPIGDFFGPDFEEEGNAH